MEWLSITLGIVLFLGLLWAFSQIGELIKAVNEAGVEIGDLKISRGRQAEDIAALSGLLRSLTDGVHERR